VVTCAAAAPAPALPAPPLLNIRWPSLASLLGRAALPYTIDTVAPHAPYASHHTRAHTLLQSFTLVPDRPPPIRVVQHSTHAGLRAPCAPHRSIVGMASAVEAFAALSSRSQAPTARAALPLKVRRWERFPSHLAKLLPAGIKELPSAWQLCPRPARGSFACAPRTPPVRAALPPPNLLPGRPR
jgi:hypothetical protein